MLDCIEIKSLQNQLSIKVSFRPHRGHFEGPPLFQGTTDRSDSIKYSGVIVDGFPKTYDQAKTLYEAGDDEDGESTGLADPATVPELVIDLTATEEFLKQRMMNLPEEMVQGTSKQLKLSDLCWLIS